MDNIGHAIDFCFRNHGGLLVFRHNRITPLYIKEVLRRLSRRSTAYLLFFVSYSLDSGTAHQHTPDTGNIQAGLGLASQMAAEAAAYRR